MERLNSSPAPSNSPISAPKILMLHGKAESGEIFRTRIRRLEDQILRRVRFPNRPKFYYLDGPNRYDKRNATDKNTSSAQQNGEGDATYFWWEGDEHTGEYKDAEKTWSYISDYLDKHGPFIGVIGFSEGALTTTMLTSILEPSRKKPDGFTSSHPPLQFAVVYNGSRQQSQEYDWMYNPKIKTPLFSVFGTSDPFVSEKTAKELVAVCEGGRAMWHPGGHYVVTKQPYLDGVIQFINGAITSNLDPDSAR